MNTTEIPLGYIALKNPNELIKTRDLENLLEKNYPPVVALLFMSYPSSFINPFPDDPDYDPQKIALEALKNKKSIYEAVNDYIEEKKNTIKPFEFSSKALERMAYQLATYQINYALATNPNAKITIPKIKETSPEKIHKVTPEDTPEEIIGKFSIKQDVINKLINDVETTLNKNPRTIEPNTDPSARKVLQAYSRSNKEGINSLVRYLESLEELTKDDSIILKKMTDAVNKINKIKEKRKNLGKEIEEYIESAKSTIKESQNDLNKIIENQLKYFLAKIGEEDLVKGISIYLENRQLPVKDFSSPTIPVFGKILKNFITSQIKKAQKEDVSNKENVWKTMNHLVEEFSKNWDHIKDIITKSFGTNQNNTSSKEVEKQEKDIYLAINAIISNNKDPNNQEQRLKEAIKSAIKNYSFPTLRGLINLSPLLLVDKAIKGIMEEEPNLLGLLYPPQIKWLGKKLELVNPVSSLNLYLHNHVSENIKSIASLLERNDNHFNPTVIEKIKESISNKDIHKFLDGFVEAPENLDELSQKLEISLKANNHSELSTPTELSTPS